MLINAHKNKNLFEIAPQTVKPLISYHNPNFFFHISPLYRSFLFCVGRDLLDVHSKQMMISYRMRNRLSYEGEDVIYETKLGKLINAKSHAGEIELNQKFCLPKINTTPRRRVVHNTHSMKKERANKTTEKSQRLVLPPIQP